MLVPAILRTQVGDLRFSRFIPLIAVQRIICAAPASLPVVSQLSDIGGHNARRPHGDSQNCDWTHSFAVKSLTLGRSTVYVLRTAVGGCFTAAICHIGEMATHCRGSTTRRGQAGREIPSFFILERRVLGGIPSAAAAPLPPEIFQLHSSSIVVMWSRSTCRSL